MHANEQHAGLTLGMSISRTRPVPGGPYESNTNAFIVETMTEEFVIFDLDGTLIESEQIWADVRRRFTEEHGGGWTDRAQQTMMGMRTNEWSHYMHDDLGVPLDPTVIAERVVAGVMARISQQVPILPGADAVIDRLAGAFTLGLATSATLAVARTVLEQTGWNKIFRVAVSADEVARGKPAPDVYLRALELLGADAASSAAVEDSGNGFLSAHAAHLSVIAVPNRAYPPDATALSRASRIVQNLDQIQVATIRDLLHQSAR